jgi:hypothetical protein
MGSCGRNDYFSDNFHLIYKARSLFIIYFKSGYYLNLLSMCFIRNIVTTKKVYLSLNV